MLIAQHFFGTGTGGSSINANMFNPGSKRYRVDISGRSSNQLMEVLQIVLEKFDALEKKNDILEKIVRGGF